MVCRPKVADLHHFDEEQDPGPHQSEKSDLDPDPKQSEKRDTDWIHIIVFRIRNTMYRHAEKPFPRQPRLYNVHNRKRSLFLRQKERASATLV
jgi:hypothetical protein